MFLYVYKKDWLGSWSFFLWVLEIFSHLCFLN